MKYSIFYLLFLLSVGLFAQSNDEKRSVQLEAQISSDPTSITLSWDDAVTATGDLDIYRREIGVGAFWGLPIATVAPTVLSYTDEDVAVNTRYEYRVRRPGADVVGNGYLLASIELEPPVERGILLLVIEEGLLPALQLEIDRYRSDVRADGWRVKSILVTAAATDVEVKAEIINRYEEAPTERHALFLLGNVAVPYSGNIAPDGHTNNHQGAWPADVFYADVDGNWTDQSVDITTASGERNDNVPGDGKWDQSTIPTNVELEVGRVDFDNLPHFSEGEIELTRRYLDKNHAFRRAAFRVPRRGLIENNFGGFAEGFGQNGLKNYATLVGRDSTRYLDYNTLKTESYLLSYGCGAGNFQGAGGISNTTTMAHDSFQTVFTFLFGSYFGDWDSSNNFLRAALGSGTILANAWAGRPNWAMHPMAVGETIGFCARQTQNNDGFGYEQGFGSRSIHVALMGDPTLRLHPVAPPVAATATETLAGVEVNWTAADETDIVGYHVYRRVEGEESFTRLSSAPLTGLSFLDLCPPAGNSYTYLVKTLRLENSPSGSYFNESLGTETVLLPTIDRQVAAAFSFVTNETEVSFTDLSQNGTAYQWDFGDGNESTVANPVHTYTTAGSYSVRLIVSNACFTDTISQTVMVLPSSTQDFSKLGARVYPNPASGQFIQLELPSAIPAHRLELFDVFGRQVWRSSDIATDRLTISVGQLPAGTYRLRLLVGDRFYQQGIVIH